mgnify:CR=1 FL=1
MFRDNEEGEEEETIEEVRNAIQHLVRELERALGRNDHLRLQLVVDRMLESEDLSMLKEVLEQLYSTPSRTTQGVTSLLSALQAVDIQMQTRAALIKEIQDLLRETVLFDETEYGDLTQKSNTWLQHLHHRLDQWPEDAAHLDRMNKGLHTLVEDLKEYESDFENFKEVVLDKYLLDADPDDRLVDNLRFVHKNYFHRFLDLLKASQPYEAKIKEVAARLARAEPVDPPDWKCACTPPTDRPNCRHCRRGWKDLSSFTVREDPSTWPRRRWRVTTQHKFRARALLKNDYLLRLLTCNFRRFPTLDSIDPTNAEAASPLINVEFGAARLKPSAHRVPPDIVSLEPGFVSVQSSFDYQTAQLFRRFAEPGNGVLSNWAKARLTKQGAGRLLAEVTKDDGAVPHEDAPLVSWEDVFYRLEVLPHKDDNLITFRRNLVQAWRVRHAAGDGQARREAFWTKVLTKFNPTDLSKKSILRAMPKVAKQHPCQSYRLRQETRGDFELMWSDLCRRQLTLARYKKKGLGLFTCGYDGRAVFSTEGGYLGTWKCNRRGWSGTSTTDDLDRHFAKAHWIREGNGHVRDLLNNKVKGHRETLHAEEEGNHPLAQVVQETLEKRFEREKGARRAAFQARLRNRPGGQELDMEERGQLLDDWDERGRELFDDEHRAEVTAAATTARAKEVQKGVDEGRKIESSLFEKWYANLVQEGDHGQYNPYHDSEKNEFTMDIAHPETHQDVEIDHLPRKVHRRVFTSAVWSPFSLVCCHRCHGQSSPPFPGMTEGATSRYRFPTVYLARGGYLVLNTVGGTYIPKKISLGRRATLRRVQYDPSIWVGYLQKMERDPKNTVATYYGKGGERFRALFQRWEKQLLVYANKTQKTKKYIKYAPDEDEPVVEDETVNRAFASFQYTTDSAKMIATFLADKIGKPKLAEWFEHLLFCADWMGEMADHKANFKPILPFELEVELVGFRPVANNGTEGTLFNQCLWSSLRDFFNRHPLAYNPPDGWTVQRLRDIASQGGAINSDHTEWDSALHLEALRHVATTMNVRIRIVPFGWLLHRFPRRVERTPEALRAVPSAELVATVVGPEDGRPVWIVAYGRHFELLDLI